MGIVILGAPWTDALMDRIEAIGVPHPKWFVAPFTVREIAESLKLSRGVITRLFENEPGIVVWGNPERMHKRKYRTFRVPRSVYERVLRRITKR